MTEEREVRLTSAERVLWPGEGITKGDLFDYYREIAPVLVPHLRNRPFTMKRWREGIARPAFFQKQAPKGMPSWIKTRRFRTFPREGGSRLVDFPLVDDERTLLWMVQMHCIDMNAWYSRIDKPHRPDFALFDLDPPEDDWLLAVEVAQLIRKRLEELDLESHVKTSGSTGIHVLVPITRRYGFDETYEFAELVTRGLEAEHPAMLTTEWLKEKRRGVLVDHRQNGWGKTIASAYSVRPRPGAPVSTPLRWRELTSELDFTAFTMDAVRERVRREGDLFEPVLHGRQALGPALRSLRKEFAALVKGSRRAQRARRA
jgi:bifunctional non-homologous end joining protein LigD